MHRSVLENRTYGRFAAENTVEVIAMEELDRALREQSPHVKTYRAKDVYGQETDYLAEFPGLTVEQLRDLSDSHAVTYMQGGRIPYTAVVDPHTLAEMEGIRGVRTAKDLIAIVSRHRDALVAAHGEGIDRRLWREVGEGLVEIDRQLGAGDIGKALAVHAELARRTTGRPEELTGRVARALEVILDDAGRLLGALEARVAAGEARAVATEARSLARVLEDTPLGERARNLVASTRT